MLLDGLCTGDAVSIKHTAGIIHISSSGQAHIHIELKDGNPLIVLEEEQIRDGFNIGAFNPSQRYPDFNYGRLEHSGG